MAQTSFARVEALKLLMIEQQVRVVLLLILISPPFDGQHERLDLPLTVLRRMMEWTGCFDSTELVGKVLRVLTDVDGEPRNIGGPTDGCWLMCEAVDDPSGPLEARD